MKKITVILLAKIFLSANLFAQNPIPNAGFETWIDYGGIYSEPESWGTQNPYFLFVETVTADSSSHSGALATRIATKGHNNTFITGIMCTGTLIVSDYSTKGGFPCNKRFGYFGGYYKYSVDSGKKDHPMMNAWMWKWNSTTMKRDTVAVASFIGDTTVGDYLAFGVEFDYKSILTPDSASITIAATDSPFNAPIGSVLLIDDIEFSGAIGIDEISLNDFSIYPNPANNELLVELPENSESVMLRIYNAEGKKLNEVITHSLKTTINTKPLLNGNYLLQVESLEGKMITSKPFVVQH